MPKRTVRVKKYQRFKNGKWESVRKHERRIDTVKLSDAFLKDIREGKAVRIETEGTEESTKGSSGNPEKQSNPEEKQKRKGLIGSAVGKIPEKVKIKGGKSKITTKQGTYETEYEDLEVGK